VMFGAALVFETRLAGDIARLRDGLASWGVATQAVLWVGLATSARSPAPSSRPC
jgi:hypothetical protein